MKKYAPLVCIAVTILSSCTKNTVDQFEASNGSDPQRVELNFQTPRYTQIKFMDAPIRLVVNDVRPFAEVGQIDDLIRERLVPIKSDKAVQYRIEKLFESTLENQGHQVSLASATLPKNNVNNMVVDIEKLYSKANQEFSIETDVQLRITLSTLNSDGGLMEMHKTMQGQTVFVKENSVTTKKEVELNIEKTVNGLIKKISTDTDLNQFMRANFERVKI